MELVTPHLKSVLKNYQHSATNSLQGPGSAPLAKEAITESTSDVVLAAAPPFPVQQLPILTTADTSRSERSETMLEGEAISCFVVGGERRLCLPQVLNSVLREFTLHQINQECDRLQIYCSRCTPEQLAELKNTGILPSGAPSCGLITQTDAERLCSALLHSTPAVTMTSMAVTAAAGVTGATGGDGDAAVSFRVYHECFGKCTGVCRPGMASARCIECAECRGLFTPRQFVCHAHRPLENRTCHWGFDSGRWRSYLHVSRDEPDRDKCARLLDALQERHAQHNPHTHHATTNGHKRKQMLLESEIIKGSDALEMPLKKSKLEEYAAYLYAASALDPLYLHAAMYEQWSTRQPAPPPPLSAFRPVSGFGTSGKSSKSRPSKETPPVLQHPERVVPLSESERFERSYQPNVALAPPPPPPPPSRHSPQISTVITAPKSEPATDRLRSAVVDSTVSVVQSSAPTAPTPRYNPEIELSTDTDDSLSDMSGESPRVEADVRRVADALAAAAAPQDTQDLVLDVVRRLASEHSRALQRLTRLERRVLELEAATTASVPVSCSSQQHQPSDVYDVTSSRTEIPLEECTPLDNVDKPDGDADTDEEELLHDSDDRVVAGTPGVLVVSSCEDENVPSRGATPEAALPPPEELL